VTSAIVNSAIVIGSTATHSSYALKLRGFNRYEPVGSADEVSANFVSADSEVLAAPALPVDDGRKP
jgi:hypothetical protein